MSFTGRSYPDIVADLLTTLTDGVTGERHPVTYQGTGRDAVAADVVLTQRPVRRVSRVTGMMLVPNSDEPVPVEFTLSDYELVGDPDEPDDRYLLRFVPAAARRPAPDSEVVVNYYPRATNGTVLTDIQPGSVVRTLLETIARELAVLYAQLDLSYDSAFVETATGSSLDRVVALLGIRRYRAGRPAGSVRFGRRAGTTGNVTIPAGTPITDSQDKIRYETTEARTMLSGESAADVRVRGATDATPVVKAGVLTVIQRAIAGVDTVVNERPTVTASDDETDVDLRTRARSALLAASKGTVPAIEYGLLQLPDVRSVRIEEMPRGVPGELRISVDIEGGGGGALPDTVQQRIEELRPAGVRIVAEPAGMLQAVAAVRLVLAGSGVTGADLITLRRSVAAQLGDAVGRTPIGQPVRVNRLTATLLADARLSDATVTLGEKGKPLRAPGADLDPGRDRGVRLAVEDVAFQGDEAERPAAGIRGAPVTVQVSARIAATPVGETTVDNLQGLLSERLGRYVGSLRAGTIVTSATVLDALRDDGAYRVDPLRLLVTFAAGDQFTQVATGGESFQVAASHRFAVDAVEVVA